MEFEPSLLCAARVRGDAVHARDEVAQAVGALEIPVAQLVFSESRYSSLPGFARGMFHELDAGT